MCVDSPGEIAGYADVERAVRFARENVDGGLAHAAKTRQDRSRLTSNSWIPVFTGTTKLVGFGAGVLDDLGPTRQFRADVARVLLGRSTQWLAAARREALEQVRILERAVHLG